MWGELEETVTICDWRIQESFPETEGRKRARVSCTSLHGEWQSGVEADSHIHSLIKATQLDGQRPC